MKETGLMFKAPLVRAILADQKTQTRRIIKDQLIGERWCESRPAGRQYLEWQGQPTCGSGVWDVPEYNAEIVSPFGLIGDRIYVRETWQHANFPLGPYDKDTTVFYRTDYLDDPHGPDGERSPEGKYRHWQPSIHMPKDAARIWLEVTGVRVERLQQISEADAQAEGCSIECMTPTGDDSGSAIYGPGGFAALWESTGGDWAANPWVWVIDFKTISTTGRPA